MSSIGKHGDPTTTGGVVIATLSSMFGDNARLAIAGDSATCGTCEGSWPIYATGTLMTDNGRNVVLDMDWVMCPCNKNRVIALAADMNYQSDERRARTATAAASGQPAAVASSVATPPPPATARPTAPVRDRDSSATQRCTLRIGVFFDGTGNNASNTELYAQCHASTATARGQSQEEQQAIAAHCEPYMLKHGSSYEGGYTNVWRLYQLYRDSSKEAFQAGDDEDYFVPIYVEGIGTQAGKPDTLLPGYTFGTGDTGMIERVRHAITELLPKKVESFGQRYPDVAIEAIEFDVFGFSRGAAAARHFVNEINRKQESPLARQLPLAPARFSRSFTLDRDVRIGFVGLFDTVVSRASLADGFNVRAGHTGPLQVGLPAGCARKVVQLAARDEHRANFMLTTVKPQHAERLLPGAHSDLGGGYHTLSEGPLMLIEPIRHAEPPEALPQLQRDLSQSRAYREAARQRLLWKQRLGEIPDDCLTVDSWLVEVQRPVNHASVVKQTVPIVYATLRLERPIDPRYQLIPLRVMHKAAVEAGVALNPLSHDQSFALPEELQPIAAKLLQDRPLDPQEEALLARRYLHQSAHWGIVGASTDYVRSAVTLPLLYPNRPEGDKDGHEQPRVALPNA